MSDPDPSNPRPPRPRALPPPTSEAMRAALDAAFAGTGATGELLDLYARFALLVLEENRRTNLTAIQDAPGMAVKHFLDSYRLLDFVDLHGRRVLDLGTGAGFPGIPLAAAIPDARFTLVDSTGKKAAFVGRAAAALGLGNVRAEWARGEELLRRERFDVVVCRAGGSVRDLLATLHPVRRAFGLLICPKGPRWEAELRAAAAGGWLRSFPLLGSDAYDLPFGAGARVVLRFRGGAER